ncbi:MAG: bifunctional oligoribonuclease/PAP phosphatase NrnA [Defluviitaleaceae bacterium]|nr:bifunctional oligoribonuclease/PAP phosphatase NrnA [Defluviitaleaceae bacterium]
MHTSPAKIWHELTKNGENIIIAAHHGPDGDAVGACFALALALDKQGLSPKVMLDKYNAKLDIVRGKEYIYDGDKTALVADVLVVVDCGDFSRISGVEDIFERAEVTVNIDHHISNNGFSQHNYVDAAVGSTCELVYDILQPNIEICKDIAGALYMGIVSDTGIFRYSATTSKTMRIVADLMQTDINFGAIQQSVMHSRTKAENAIFTRALQKITYIDNITYTIITQKDLQETGAAYADLDGIVEYLLNIEGTKAAVFFTERTNGRIKASFRGRDVDVNVVATAFGGGGHKFAAAASFESSLDKGVAAVLVHLQKVVGNV